MVSDIRSTSAVSAGARASRPSRAFRFGLVPLAGLALLLGACAADDEAMSEAPRDTVSNAGSDGDSAVGPGGGMALGGAPSGEGAMAPEPSKNGSVTDASGQTTLPSVLGRTILRNGSISLTVESVSGSFDRVRQIAEGAGGFVSDSSFYGSGEEQSASLTLRVPADQFAKVVSDLSALAIEVDSVQTSSQDVTEEYTDLQATVRNQQAVEAQYLVLLGEAKTIADILTVQDRLASVRLQIEQAQGRINMLDNLASLATLSVRLTPESAAPPAEEADGFTHKVSEAWESSLNAMAAVGTGVAVALVWSWWLLPLIPVTWILWRRFGPRITAAKPHVDTPVGPA